MRKLSALGACLIAAVSLLGFNAPVRGASIILTNTPAPTFAGGFWSYSYTVVVDAGSHVETGDFFVIYDFVGFDPTFNGGTGFLAVLPAFTLSLEPGNVGPGTPGLPPTNDSAAVPNIVGRYSGAPGSFLPGGVLTNGTFTARSTVGPGTISYRGEDTAGVGPAGTGAPQANFGTTGGPSVVPLPAAVWGGLGLMGFISAGKFRRPRLALD